MGGYKTGSWGEHAQERGKKRLDYFREYKKEWRVKRRLEVIEKLGGKCSGCGFSDHRALQIDHVNGGGNKEYRKLGQVASWNKMLKDTEGLYQLLCANCNWIKRYNNKEYGGSPRKGEVN